MRKKLKSWAQSELIIALKYFPACHTQAGEEEEGVSSVRGDGNCSVGPAGGGALRIPPGRQCCLSTEEEWPSLLGAAVRM